jgi:hypothetical protein
VEGKNKPAAQSSVASKQRTAPSFDDSSLAFLDNSGDALADRKARQACVLKLLDERRAGLLWCGKQRRWQSRALFTFTKKPEKDTESRRQWRPLAKRSIPFTQLGTPLSDAVLAVERTGSYVLSLGGKDSNSNVPLALALRFYGKSREAVPPASMSSQEMQIKFSPYIVFSIQVFQVPLGWKHGGDPLDVPQRLH